MPSAPEPAAPPGVASPALVDRPSAAARPFLYGLAVAGVFTAAYLGACMARGAGSVAVPIASLTALQLVAAAPLLQRAARWAGAPRPESCAAWSLLGAVPLLILGAMVALGNTPVVASHWYCGTGDIGFAILSPIAFALLGALGGLFSFAITSAPKLRGGGSFVRFLSRGALLLGTVLVGAAAYRAQHAPSTDDATRYLESLPILGVLPPPPSPGGASVEQGSEIPTEDAVDETRFGDIVIRRSCNHGACSILLRRDAAPPPTEKLGRDSGRTSLQEPEPVQRDEAHGLLIVGRSSAFRERDLALTDVSIRDIGDALSAPLGWILGGAAGLLVALGLMIRRRRLAQRLLDIEAAQAGSLGDNGWITFDDDTAALRAPSELADAAGPVLRVRRVGSRTSAGGYRSEGALGADEIVAGSRGDLASRLRARMAALDILGLTAVLLTAAPLLASWSFGLVFGGR